MTLVGHDDLWRTWRAAAAGPRMHHGWILSGPRGLGKAGFAIQAARELVQQPGIPQPEGNHPDILTLEPLPATSEDEKKRDEGRPYQTKRNITVDQVRSVQQRLTTRPTLGDRRVIIIDPADELEKGAANALLKSLEEPPAGTYFLLISHRPGRLLPTIRSRCRTLRFPVLSDDEVRRIIENLGQATDPSALEAAIAASGGSPGAALEFLQHDLGTLHRLMLEIVARGDADFSRRGRLADAIGARPDRRRQMATIELARAVVTQTMNGASRSQIPSITSVHDELVRLGTTAPTHNYDAGLLVMEIGTLLASLAVPSEPAHA